MSQNRKKLIDLLIGNLSNAIVHEILDEAIESEEVSSKYRKEIEVSLNKAKSYRQKINPKNVSLSEKDRDFIKKKLINKVKARLSQRALDDYENINLNLIEVFVDKVLEKMEVK